MDKDTIAAHTAHLFEESFHETPRHIFLSPGRINIIGEHIDYNDGYVLPAAINKYVCLAISESTGPKCVIVAGDINEQFEFDLNDALEPVGQMWANYFLGVIQEFKDRNFTLNGFRAVFTSTVPIGSGLSSSAAVECAFAYAINELHHLGVDKKDLALIGQKAEHTFVGVMCGIMDQFASIFGKENKVIRLDCITLEYEYHNADFKEYSLLLLDSNVKHTNLTSGYNTRREETAKGLSILRTHFPEVKTFRDCTSEQVVQVREQLGDTIFHRCHFVVKEIHRVTAAVNALEASDFKKLGALMFETHYGLSVEYEVSCDETDFLVDAVRNIDTVLGARMMGGGFGGCTINLVETNSIDDLIVRISKEYLVNFNIELKPYKIKISDGTSRYQ